MIELYAGGEIKVIDKDLAGRLCTLDKLDTFPRQPHHALG